MSKGKNGGISLCIAYCFLEILISTEIIYLIPSSFFSILKYVLAAVMTAYVLFDMRHIRFNSSHIPLALCALVAVATAIFARTLQIYMLLLIILLLRGYSFRQILRPMYVMLWAVFIFTLLMSLANIYPNVDHSRNGTVRNALGFGTPTLGQSILLFLLLSHFYLKKNKMSYISIALYLIAVSAMYAFTVGRTGYYLSLFAIAAIFLYKICSGAAVFKKFSSSNILCLAFMALPFVLLVLTLVLTRLYEAGVPFAVKLNAALSTRLELQMNALNERPITLFGQNIAWYNSQNIYIGIDNSYLYHLFNYGLVVFVAALFMYSYILYGAWRRGDVCMMLVVVIILIDGIVEPYMLDFKYNYFILCIGSYVLNAKRTQNYFKNSLIFNIRLKNKEKAV